MYCTSKSNFEKESPSKSFWIREQRPSEKELLESLCNEIQTLTHESKYFEIQYRTLLNYYRGLSHQMVA